LVDWKLSSLIRQEVIYCTLLILKTLVELGVYRRGCTE